MGINGTNGISPSLSSFGTGAAGNGSGNEAQIRSLEKKLTQLQDEKKKAVAAKDQKKVEKLEKKIQEEKKQIEELKRRQKKEEEEGEYAPDGKMVKTPGAGDAVDEYA